MRVVSQQFTPTSGHLGPRHLCSSSGLQWRSRNTIECYTLPAYVQSRCAVPGMASAFIKQTALPSPPERAPEAIVEVFALQAGHLTLPERFFVHPASPTTRRTVPSLAFLIEHQEEDTKKKTRILFDLGLRRDPQRYPEPIQNHIATRQPLTTDPDVVKSLAAGGLGPDDIDFVLYSHVSGFGQDPWW